MSKLGIVIWKFNKCKENIKDIKQLNKTLMEW